MTQQTALDEAIDMVRNHRPYFKSLGDTTRCVLHRCPDGIYAALLQDPRYLAYCKEQDEREDLVRALSRRLPFDAPPTPLQQSEGAAARLI